MNHEDELDLYKTEILRLTQNEEGSEKINQAANASLDLSDLTSPSRKVQLRRPTKKLSIARTSLVVASPVVDGSESSLPYATVLRRNIVGTTLPTDVPENEQTSLLNHRSRHDWTQSPETDDELRGKFLCGSSWFADAVLLIATIIVVASLVVVVLDKWAAVNHWIRGLEQQQKGSSGLICLVQHTNRTIADYMIRHQYAMTMMALMQEVGVMQSILNDTHIYSLSFFAVTDSMSGIETSRFLQKYLSTPWLAHTLDLVQNHIVMGTRIETADFHGQSVMSMAGYPIRLYRKDMNLTQPYNLIASNGLMHGITEFMYPPWFHQSIWQVISRRPACATRFKPFRFMLETTRGPFTVLCHLNLRTTATTGTTNASEYLVPGVNFVVEHFDLIRSSLVLFLSEKGNSSNGGPEFVLPTLSHSNITVTLVKHSGRYQMGFINGLRSHIKEQILAFNGVVLV